jgi:hypothetical protein
MNGNYVVCNKRKSDGKLFFGERVRTYGSRVDATAEAERRARECSKDYAYAVVELSIISLSELAVTPVVTRYV